MTIKVDLEKAYDRLEWNFIHKILQAYHFPNKLINLIMNCVSSTSISILFKGGMMETFKTLRGIRQDNLMFPYLFILCMEYLGSLTDKECMEGDWAPKASRGNLKISHILFADDLILFAKASEEESESIKEVLDLFCCESRQ